MVASEHSIPLLQRFRYVVEFLVLWALFSLFGVLSLDKASALGGFLGAKIGPHLSITRRALINLKIAFPDWSDSEVMAIVRGMWDHLGRVVAEYPHLGEFDFYSGDGRMQLIGAEYLDELRDDQIAGIFIAGHIGNWELGSLAATQRDLPLVNIYRAANNPYVEKLIQRARDPIGVRHHPKSLRGARALLKAVNRGDHVGIMVDQKYNEGISVPFFGTNAMTTTAPADIAIRYKIPLVPVRVERVSGANFRMTVFPPLDIPDTGNFAVDTRAIMTEVNSLLESWIRERPEQWLWLHRRWPDGF